jgi:nucleotide-binding universal stress UspA family protein
MIAKILLGYDGTDSSHAAFDFALDMARRHGAELHVLAVARPPDFGEDLESRTIVEQSQRHLKRVLAALKPKLSEASIRGFFEVAVGHPAEQLVRYVDEHEIDHLVVGHRGHSLFERLLLGSVARQAIAYAACGVTVVRSRSAVTKTGKQERHKP